MSYLDITTEVILSPVPCVQITVADSVTDSPGGLGVFPVAAVNRINADGTVEQVRSQRMSALADPGVFVDYECPQQEQVTYQAAMRLSTGAPPVSAPVVLPDVGAWLIDPVNPAGSVPIDVQQGGFAGWTRASTVSVTPIAGSAMPYVVESSVRQAPTGDLSVWVFNSAAHDALLATLATPGPKLFSWPRRQWKGYGQVRWAFVTNVTDTPGTAMNVRWGAQLSLQPSARPAVVPASFAKSWEDLRGKTWDGLRGTTWDDL